MSIEHAAQNDVARTTETTETAEYRLVHLRLTEYARQRSALEAAEAFDLVRAEQLKLYAVFGCASHFDYLERKLGYKPHTARERMRVAKALVRLPVITAELARGDRQYAAARELTRVATAETEGAWLAATAGMSTAQIEARIVGYRQGDHPDDPAEPMIRSRKLHLELPPEVFALWREARKVLAEERGGEVSDAELVEAMCRRVLEPGTGSEGPAHQIAYKQCGECRRTTQNGAGREIDVAPEVFERAACDASNLGSLDASVPDRTTTTVTPRVRQQVFARDNFRCRVPGCRSARNLEVHHIRHQADGGSHELSNLCLLCSGHHAALHAGLLTMRGEAPHMIRFEWRAWSPLPPALSAEQREAMVRDRLRERLGSPPESEQDRLDEQLEQELGERRRRPSHATPEPGRPAGRNRVAA